LPRWSNATPFANAIAPVPGSRVADPSAVIR
jgi:hypothetical protein